VRDRLGRIVDSKPLALTAVQAKAVERLMRAGRSLQDIADAIGVSRNTLQRRLRDQLAYIPRRGRAWMDVTRRKDPSQEELRQQLAGLRRP